MKLRGKVEKLTKRNRYGVARVTLYEGWDSTHTTLEAARESARRAADFYEVGVRIGLYVHDPDDDFCVTEIEYYEPKC